MNKCIGILLGVLISVTVIAQTNTKDFYLQKAKKQKTTGWILLGGGVVTSFVGLSQLNFAGSRDGHVNNTPGAVLFFAGLAATITSIPVFSAAKRNRKKAVSLSFEDIRMPLLKSRSLVYHPIPAVSLKINL